LPLFPSQDGTGGMNGEVLQSSRHSIK